MTVPNTVDNPATATGSGETVRTITSSTTLLTTDKTVLVDASAGAVTVTLPAVGSNANKIYRIKKIDSTTNPVTIDGNASDSIDEVINLGFGFLTWVMRGVGEEATIQSNGTFWSIIASFSSKRDAKPATSVVARESLSSTDDIRAADYRTIQDALNGLQSQGGSIYLHDGSHGMADFTPISLSAPSAADDFVIEGAGEGTQILLGGSAEADHAFFDVVNSGRIHIKNLRITGGDQSNQTVFDIADAITPEIILEDVTIENVANIVELLGASSNPRITFIRCTINVANATGALLWDGSAGSGDGTFIARDCVFNIDGGASTGGVLGNPDIRWDNVEFTPDTAEVSNFGYTIMSNCRILAGQINLNDPRNLISNCAFDGQSAVGQAFNIASTADFTTITACDFQNYTNVSVVLSSGAHDCIITGCKGLSINDGNNRVTLTGNTGYGTGSTFGDETTLDGLNWFNVRTFGALGDGTTDDAAAIQEALDQLPSEGGVIYFPNGDYNVNTQINIPTSKPVIFRGAGIDATRLDLNTSVGNLILINGNHEYRFEDMTFAGDGSTGHTGFEFGNAVDGSVVMYFNNIRVEGFDDLFSRISSATPHISTSNCEFDVPDNTSSTVWSAGAGTWDSVNCRITTGTASNAANITGNPELNWSRCLYDRGTSTMTLGGRVRWTNVEFIGGEIDLSSTANESMLVGCSFSSKSGTFVRHIDLSGPDNVFIVGCFFDSNATGSNINLSTTSNGCSVIGNMTPNGIADANTSITTPNFFFGNRGHINSSSNLAVIDGQNIQTVTGNTTLDETYRTVLVNTGTATIDLPAANTFKHWIFTIKKISASAGTITIDGNGDNIDGQATNTDIVNQYDSITIQSDGNNWYIL